MTEIIDSILTPAPLLVILSLVIWATMIATRAWATIKAGVPWQAARHTADPTQLPGKSCDISDNHNHLMEQTTIFMTGITWPARLASWRDQGTPSALSQEVA